MVLNQELNGVELYFNSKPVQNIIDSLKTNGFRWHNFKKCWYAKQNTKTLAEAQKYSGIETPITEETKENNTQIKPKKEKSNLSLWELTRWTEQNNINDRKPTKEIAAEIRKHVRERFPMCKFSVTSDYSSISFYIVSSPYEQESEYLKAIEEYCTNLIKSYHYCTCDDPYGDYGSSYNFYGAYAKIDYHYTQTEQTEEIKKNMIDFDNKKVIAEEEEEIQKEKEFAEQLIKQEQEKKEREIREQEEKRQIKVINNSVNVINLEEEKQYFVIGSQFAKLNKNCTLDQYKEEVEKDEFNLENVKITREIHFNTQESLNYFSNMLLNDFDFLSETGGSFTDDVRINSMTDYYNMTKEEQETVIWSLYGVAVYFNNKLQFIIDTQGYSYSRYVGLVENVIIKKQNIIKQFIDNKQIQELKEKADTITDISTNIITELNINNSWNNEDWKTYKDLLKEQLKKHDIKLNKGIIQQLPEEMETLKGAMYKLLKEVDGIQEQFKNADLQQGQKVTLFYITDFGGMAQSKITVDKVEYTNYAQYDQTVKLTFIPERKRTKYYKHFHGDMLIYNGWLELPEEVLHSIEKTGTGMIITQTKYMSCDKKQYDEILNHFEEKGARPIINTYKPIF
jgi:hypothetical protein